jgi:DNA-binding XRE family transcriptional regulator
MAHSVRLELRDRRTKCACQVASARLFSFGEVAFRSTVCGTSLIGDEGNEGVVTPKQFKEWRKKLGLKQKEAAEHLGLNKRMIQYYEKGERDGKKVEIPLYVRLACYAVEENVADYDGAAVKNRDEA